MTWNNIDRFWLDLSTTFPWTFIHDINFSFKKKYLKMQTAKYFDPFFQACVLQWVFIMKRNLVLQRKAHKKLGFSMLSYCNGWRSSRRTSAGCIGWLRSGHRLMVHTDRGHRLQKWVIHRTAHVTLHDQRQFHNLEIFFLTLLPTSFYALLLTLLCRTFNYFKH